MNHTHAYLYLQSQIDPMLLGRRIRFETVSHKAGQTHRDPKTKAAKRRLAYEIDNQHQMGSITYLCAVSPASALLLSGQ
jgi:hypothetical protein